jgi:hypothetical protein
MRSNRQPWTGEEMRTAHASQRHHCMVSVARLGTEGCRQRCGSLSPPQFPISNGSWRDTVGHKERVKGVWMCSDSVVTAEARLVDLTD